MENTPEKRKASLFYRDKEIIQLSDWREAKYDYFGIDFLTKNNEMFICLRYCHEYFFNFICDASGNLEEADCRQVKYEYDSASNYTVYISFSQLWAFQNCDIAGIPESYSVVLFVLKSLGFRVVVE